MLRSTHPRRKSLLSFELESDPVMTNFAGGFPRGPLLLVVLHKLNILKSSNQESLSDFDMTRRITLVFVRTGKKPWSFHLTFWVIAFIGISCVISAETHQILAIHIMHRAQPQQRQQTRSFLYKVSPAYN